MLHLIRTRAQALLALTIGLLAMALIGSVISSCHRRSIRPGRPILPPPPPSATVIRVRLADDVDLARVGAAGPCRLFADAAPVARVDGPFTPSALRRLGRDWQLGAHRLTGQVLRIQPKNPADTVHFNGRAYRGTLVMRAVAGSSRSLFHVDNHVPLESYLPGVLARELPHSWRDETYKAQAVAARTYALYESRHGGRRKSFDVYADQRSQVYGGVADETGKSLAAVARTRGQVLVVGSGGSPARIVKTYYSSCCGGMTNPAKGLEPQDRDVAPLRGGVVCTDCRFSRRFRWPTVRIPRSDVFRSLARCYRLVDLLGPLETLRVRSATPWGRPQWVTIVAVDGRDAQIRADDLRLALRRYGPPDARKLHSANSTIRDLGDVFAFEGGKGFGHGVGLCQYGAEGKARRGMTYDQILAAYYPGARIVQMNLP